MAKIIAPVVTIFNEEEKPDYAGNKKVIDFLIEGGLDGILVLGSAGEFPDLNEQERLDFFRFYAEYVNGRVELLAGTGCIRYADTLALSNAVYELGYTPMVISPYYFEMDQEKLFVYYDRLAKDVKGGPVSLQLPAPHRTFHRSGDDPPPDRREPQHHRAEGFRVHPRPHQYGVPGGRGEALHRLLRL